MSCFCFLIFVYDLSVARSIPHPAIRHSRGTLDVQRCLFNLHRRLLPIDVIRSKAQEYVDANLVDQQSAHAMVRVIEQERGGESVFIERHGLDERVYTVQGDGFAGLPGQRFDLIVSNPPYVDAEDFADMPAEYQHEPELGLACGDDGLNLVRRMLAEAADHLSEKGLLIIEVGNSQVHVEALYPEVDFTWLEFERGGHGVFMLAAQQCREHQALFRQRLNALN